MPTHRPSLAELSLTELAELTGKSKETARKRLDRAGLEPSRVDGRTTWWDPRLALPVILGLDAVDPARERALLDSVRRELEELKLAERRGELVRAADVEAALVSVTSAIQVRILSVPAATAQELAASSDPAECHAITEKALHAALHDLASARVVAPEPRRQGGRAKAAQGEGDAGTGAGELDS